MISSVLVWPSGDFEEAGAAELEHAFVDGRLLHVFGRRKRVDQLPQFRRDVEHFEHAGAARVAALVALPHSRSR